MSRQRKSLIVELNNAVQLLKWLNTNIKTTNRAEIWMARRRKVIGRINVLLARLDKIDASYEKSEFY